MSEEMSTSQSTRTKFVSFFQESLERNSQIYQKEMKARNMNFPAWFLVLFAIVAAMCLNLSSSVANSFLKGLEKSSCFDTVPESDVVTEHVGFLFGSIIIALLFPFTGWFADTKIGRDTGINYSLWLCWFGALLQSVSFCIQYATCGLPVNIAKYGISVVAIIALFIGTAGLFTNAPAYGLDQLMDKSNTHIRAFVHWAIWGLFVGYLFKYNVLAEQNESNAIVVQIIAFVIFSFTSLVLCLHAWFRNHFELVGIQNKNPYKMVYNILKYAWYHKKPERRSALTYWENKLPSRVDLGKSKYGGPFSEEDVENVKTFLRMVVVLLSTLGFYLPYYHAVNGVLTYVNTFEGATTTLNGYGSFVLWHAFDSQIILIVPLVELVIMPFFPKIEYFILNPSRGIGCAHILLLIALVCMCILEIVGHFVTSGDVACATSLGSSGYDLVQLSFLYYSISLLFAGLAHALIFLYGLEFISSQAPRNMSGMLLGIFWLISAIYVNIGRVFTFMKYSGPGRVPCSFWILLLQVGIGVVGLILYTLVARWYQRRRKGEDYEVQAVVEATYDHIFAEMERREESSSLTVESVENNN